LSPQPVRSYLVIAAAIVIAGVLISASLFVAIGGAKTTTSTLTATATTTSTATTTETSTSTVASTTTKAEAFVWLDSEVCTGQGGYGPCWGLPPHIFACTSQSLLAGPAPSVCPEKVTSAQAPYSSYNITITIPFGNGPPWANCGWVVPGTSDQGDGYCIPLNATSFIMGMPFNPPPTPG